MDRQDKIARAAWFKRRYTPIELGEKLREAAQGSRVHYAGPNAEEVRVLLAAGADTEQCDDLAHFTPLLCAVSNHDFTIAELLVGAGANVNAFTSLESTPLREAARAGCADITLLLLNNKADVNFAGMHGWTALMDAADAGHAGIVALLLEHGALADGKDKFGDTALDLARAKGHAAAVNILEIAHKQQQDLRYRRICADVGNNLALQGTIETKILRPKKSRPPRP